LRSPIPAVARPQIESEEAWWAAMEHQIVESRLALAVNGNDLAIKGSVLTPKLHRGEMP
jgi:hypothetical protein